MKTVTQIVSEYGRRSHPLGKSITHVEAPILATKLRRRLMMSEIELDLSPPSLQRLEKALFEHCQEKPLAVYSEEDLLLFVREIAAYVGEVLSLHTGGKWEPLGTLLGTRMIFEGNIKIVKEGHRRNAPSIAFSLGNIGAAALDMCFSGKKPLLYRDYLSARKRIFKEDV